MMALLFSVFLSSNVVVLTRFLGSCGLEGLRGTLSFFFLTVPPPWLCCSHRGGRDRDAEQLDFCVMY
jgi:hypothetical protein